MEKPALICKTGKTKHSKSLGLFKCECGREFEAVISNVKSGNTNSCGQHSLAKTHGFSNTKTYRAWASARDRCFNKNVRKYATYGAKGITMCDKWAKSFQSFLSDMGEAPQGKSLDRINTLGNYEPGNCRWADIYEQNRNTISTSVWFIDGLKFETQKEAAEHFNVNKCTIGTWVNGRYGGGRNATPKENCFKVPRYGVQP